MPSTRYPFRKANSERRSKFCSHDDIDICCSIGASLSIESSYSNQSTSPTNVIRSREERRHRCGKTKGDRSSAPEHCSHHPRISRDDLADPHYYNPPAKKLLSTCVITFEFDISLQGSICLKWPDLAESYDLFLRFQPSALHLIGTIMRRFDFFMFGFLILGSEAFLSKSPLSSSAVTVGSLGKIEDASSYSSPSSSSSALQVIAGTKTAEQRARRKELLSRNGPYFRLDRLEGGVEFGSTAKLVTKLTDEPNLEGISEWLSDGRGMALSIWDEDLISELGDALYRLQLMKLQFVTIQLSPSVDVEMWTQRRKEDGSPLFMLQSVDFDPNIELLPGVGLSASSLGIQIEVVGQLRPSKDGKGVTGGISFATRGNLPPPMRLLPEPALKAASDTINDTIVQFAIKSFQAGAIQKYEEFKKAQ